MCAARAHRRQLLERPPGAADLSLPACRSRWRRHSAGGRVPGGAQAGTDRSRGAAAAEHVAGAFSTSRQRQPHGRVPYGHRPRPRRQRKPPTCAPLAPGLHTRLQRKPAQCARLVLAWHRRLCHGSGAPSLTPVLECFDLHYAVLPPYATLPHNPALPASCSHAAVAALRLVGNALLAQHA